MEFEDGTDAVAESNVGVEEKMSADEVVDSEETLDGGSLGEIEQKENPERVDESGGVRGLNKKVIVGLVGGAGALFFLVVGVQMIGGSGEADEEEEEEGVSRLREGPRGEGDVSRLMEDIRREEEGEEREEIASQREIIEAEGFDSEADALAAAYESEKDGEDVEDEENPWVQAREQAERRRAQMYYQEAMDAERGDVFMRVSEPRELADELEEDGDNLAAMAEEARQVSAVQRELLADLSSEEGNFGSEMGVERVNRAGGGAKGGEGDRGGREQYTGYEDWEGVSDAVLRDAPQHAVQAGTMIRLVLETGIKSDLPGLVQARVRSPVYDSVTGREILIPSGSTVIGEYQSDLGYGQERVGIAWQRLILPNGKSIMLGGVPGTDAGGHGGVSDQVDRRTGRIVGVAALSTVLATGAGVAAGPRSQFEESPGQAALGAFGVEAAEHGEELVDRELDVAPRVEVRPGMKVGAVVREDLILEPYRGN